MTAMQAAELFSMIREVSNAQLMDINVSAPVATFMSDFVEEKLSDV